MKQCTREDWLKQQVFIGEEVDLSRIANDVILHPGCRIQGTETSIGPGSVLGAEAPVTLENCQLGRGVELKGGYFAGSVFFEGANMGSGAHVRAGTILEEEANGAHTVGLKQTILQPFVTLGSLINFCDVMMAGGTSRKDHSEVGSSYIHFNFTPHQDKATASLLGDVPGGVFLDCKPIFLGGQGGLVGPARIAYGSVIAAGGVCRKDVLEEDKLVIPAAPKAGMHSYKTGVYRNAERTIENNLTYLGNLFALREWYRQVRPFCVRDEFDQHVLDGGLKNLDLAIAERIKRLGDLAAKFEHSVEWLMANEGSAKAIAFQQRFLDAWPALKDQLEHQSFEKGPIDELKGDHYTNAVRSMDEKVKEAGRSWLQTIVNSVEQLWS